MAREKIVPAWQPNNYAVRLLRDGPSEERLLRVGGRFDSGGVVQYLGFVLAVLYLLEICLYPQISIDDLKAFSLRWRKNRIEVTKWPGLHSFELPAF